jgi:hypothetical protein
MEVRKLAAAATVFAALALFVAACANQPFSPSAVNSGLGTGSLFLEGGKDSCSDKIDNDGDKLTDCADPECAEDPACKDGGGEGCSPGYWKNHLDEFNAVCGSVPGWTCDSLLTALTCKGSDASCRRSDAAEALNAITGCTE